MCTKKTLGDVLSGHISPPTWSPPPWSPPPWMQTGDAIAIDRSTVPDISPASKVSPAVKYSLFRSLQPGSNQSSSEHGSVGSDSILGITNRRLVQWLGIRPRSTINPDKIEENPQLGTSIAAKYCQDRPSTRINSRLRSKYREAKTAPNCRNMPVIPAIQAIIRLLSATASRIS